MYVPQFSIQKDVGGHGSKNVVREGKRVAPSRIKELLLGIPKSAQSIIFFKQPPMNSSFNETEFTNMK